GTRRERLTDADPYPGTRSARGKRAHAVRRARGRLPLPGVRRGRGTGAANGVLGCLSTRAKPETRAGEHAGRAAPSPRPSRRFADAGGVAAIATGVPEDRAGRPTGAGELGLN